MQAEMPTKPVGSTLMGLGHGCIVVRYNVVMIAYLVLLALRTVANVVTDGLVGSCLSCTKVYLLLRAN
jgi:hypothetical protein